MILRVQQATNGVSLSAGIALPTTSTNGKDYSNRSNCVAGARSVLGDSAKPDVDFTVDKTGGGRFVWTAVSKKDPLDLPKFLDASLPENKKLRAEAQEKADRERKATAVTTATKKESDVGTVVSLKDAKAKKTGKGGKKAKGESKLAMIVGMLKRPGGCTTKDILKATGWPAVSVPQQAKAAKLKLKKEKKDGITVYSAA